MTPSFLNPLLLWGLLLASLPIIIHLINRRKARKVKFSATYFVMLTNKRLARSLKLKQFLLLLFRTLLLLLLPLLLAHLFFMPKEAEINDETLAAPATRILILDRSYSMQASVEGERLFSRAKQKAADLIAGFSGDDAFALIAAGGEDAGEEDIAIDPTFERAPILDAIESLQASYGLTSFAAAMERAKVMLEMGSLPLKRVYIIGDMTRFGYEQQFAIESEEEAVTVVPVDIGSEEAEANLSIESLEAKPSFFTGAKDWKINVRVKNHSSKAVEGFPISLFADGEELTGGFIEVAPNQSAMKEFIVRFDKAGEIKLVAKIGEDTLDVDNRRFRLVSVSKTIRALVVNGQPNPTRHLDEVFYLSEALNPGALGRSRIHPKVITADWLMNESFVDYDIVYLCHLPRIEEAVAQALEDFVSEGGALVVTVGEHVDIENYNERILSLLPGRLRGERVGGDPTATSDAIAPVFLSRMDYGQEAFRIFDDETAKSLYEAEVRRYLTFDPDARKRKEVLLSFSDSSPALVKTPVGEGVSVLLTTTIDRGWNDIPIQPGFVPLMQELSHALVKRGDETKGRILTVGERHRFKEGTEAKALTFPNDEKRNDFNDPNEKKRQTPRLSMPGFYEVQTEKGTYSLAVNVNPAESALQRMPKEELLARFQAGEETNAALASLGIAGQKRDMSNLLAWLLLLIFAAEVFLLRSMR